MTAATRGDIWTVGGLVTAITLAVGAMSWTTMTQQWSIAEKLGEQTEIVRTIQSDANEQKVAIGELTKAAERIRLEVAWRNADPKALMAKAGLPVDQDIDYASIGDKVIALPRTSDAAVRLIGMGMKRAQFTPVFGGYITDDATASAIRSVILDASASQSRMVFPNLQQSAPN